MIDRSSCDNRRFGHSPLHVLQHTFNDKFDEEGVSGFVDPGNHEVVQLHGWMDQTERVRRGETVIKQRDRSRRPRSIIRKEGRSAAETRIREGHVALKHGARGDLHVSDPLRGPVVLLPDHIHREGHVCEANVLVHVTNSLRVRGTQHRVVALGGGEDDEDDKNRKNGGQVEKLDGNQTASP